jgi:hypothetical protein
MATHMHQHGANGDEPDPAKSPGHDPILPEPEMSPSGGPEPPAKSRERGSSADVLAGDGERSPDDIGEDEDIVRARAPCWAGRISLIDSDPEKLGILYGFARKLINEAAQAGVVLEAEAEDLAHTAIRRALEGRLRRRKANAPPATGSSAADVDSSNAEDSVGIALSILCTTIGNELRNQVATLCRRRQGAVMLPRRVPANPAGTVELGIDLNRAIEPLPDRQREAFIAVCVHDQEPAVYAAERGIAPQTARNHVNLAKRKLRSSLPDYLR